MVSIRSIADLLAPTLGWEKSAELVTDACQRLGLAGATLSVEQAMALLDDLAAAPGLVGVTARFARSRAKFKVASIAPPPREAPPPSRAPMSGATPRSSQRPVPVRELIDLLAPTIGVEKSEEAIRDGLRRLNLPEDMLDKAQAMRLFDDLAATSGLVGVTARFAKSRLLLRFTA